MKSKSDFPNGTIALVEVPVWHRTNSGIGAYSFDYNGSQFNSDAKGLLYLDFKPFGLVDVSTKRGYVKVEVVRHMDDVGVCAKLPGGTLHKIHYADLTKMPEPGTEESSIHEFGGNTCSTDSNITVPDSRCPKYRSRERVIITAGGEFNGRTAIIWQVHDPLPNAQRYMVRIAGKPGEFQFDEDELASVEPDSKIKPTVVGAAFQIGDKVKQRGTPIRGKIVKIDVTGGTPQYWVAHESAAGTFTSVGPYVESELKDDTYYDEEARSEGEAYVMLDGETRLSAAQGNPEAMARCEEFRLKYKTPVARTDQAAFNAPAMALISKSDEEIEYDNDMEHYRKGFRYKAKHAKKPSLYGMTANDIAKKLLGSEGYIVYVMELGDVKSASERVTAMLQKRSADSEIADILHLPYNDDLYVLHLPHPDSRMWIVKQWVPQLSKAQLRTYSAGGGSGDEKRAWKIYVSHNTNERRQKVIRSKEAIVDLKRTHSYTSLHRLIKSWYALLTEEEIKRFEGETQGFRCTLQHAMLMLYREAERGDFSNYRVHIYQFEQTFRWYDNLSPGQKMTFLRNQGLPEFQAMWNQCVNIGLAYADVRDYEKLVAEWWPTVPHEIRMHLRNGAVHLVPHIGYVADYETAIRLDVVEERFKPTVVSKSKPLPHAPGHYHNDDFKIPSKYVPKSRLQAKESYENEYFGRRNQAAKEFALKKWYKCLTKHEHYRMSADTFNNKAEREMFAACRNRGWKLHRSPTQYVEGPHVTFQITDEDLCGMRPTVEAAGRAIGKAVDNMILHGTETGRTPLHKSNIEEVPKTVPTPEVKVHGPFVSSMSSLQPNAQNLRKADNFLIQAQQAATTMEIMAHDQAIKYHRAQAELHKAMKFVKAYGGPAGCLRDRASLYPHQEEILKRFQNQWPGIRNLRSRIMGVEYGDLTRGPNAQNIPMPAGVWSRIVRAAEQNDSGIKVETPESLAAKLGPPHTAARIRHGLGWYDPPAPHGDASGIVMNIPAYKPEFIHSRPMICVPGSRSGKSLALGVAVHKWIQAQYEKHLLETGITVIVPGQTFEEWYATLPIFDPEFEINKIWRPEMEFKNEWLGVPHEPRQDPQEWAKASRELLEEDITTRWMNWHKREPDPKPAPQGYLVTMDMLYGFHDHDGQFFKNADIRITDGKEQVVHCLNSAIGVATEEMFWKTDQLTRCTTLMTQTMAQMRMHMDNYGGSHWVFGPGTFPRRDARGHVLMSPGWYALNGQQRIMALMSIERDQYFYQGEAAQVCDRRELGRVLGKRRLAKINIRPYPADFEITSYGDGFITLAPADDGWSAPDDYRRTSDGSGVNSASAAGDPANDAACSRGTCGQQDCGRDCTRPDLGLSEVPRAASREDSGVVGGDSSSAGQGHREPVRPHRSCTTGQACAAIDQLTAYSMDVAIFNGLSLEQLFPETTKRVISDRVPRFI